ncbi:MAG: polyprenyl synthetase [Dehalococcoidia bacterium]|nr:polyprenyl synthetase [Dehalococcoidia bacterium]
MGALNAGPFQRLRPVLEDALRKHIGDGRSPLHEMLRYYMGWADERGSEERGVTPDMVHGTMCLLAAESLGESASSALPAAVAVELAVASSEIHRDLREGSPTRGNRQALWWVYGHAQGINAGDGAYSLARLALMDLDAMRLGAGSVLRCLAILDQSWMEGALVIADQINQAEESAVSSSEHLTMVEGEYGARMAAAVSIGAVCAVADLATVDRLGKFGRYIGSGCRLREELDTLWPRESAAGGQIVETLDKKRSLPLLYGLEHAAPRELEAIKAVASREQPIDDLRTREVLEIVERTGARRYGEGLIRELLAKGIEALGDSGGKADVLVAAAQGLLTRGDE